MLKFFLCFSVFLVLPLFFFISFPGSPLSPSLWRMIFCMLFYGICFLTVFISCANIHRALVLLCAVELWSHELTGQTIFPRQLFINDCQVFCMEVCSTVRSCLLTECSFATFMPFYILCCQLERNRLVGAYIKKTY